MINYSQTVRLNTFQNKMKLTRKQLQFELPTRKHKKGSNIKGPFITDLKQETTQYEIRNNIYINSLKKQLQENREKLLTANKKFTRLLLHINEKLENKIKNFTKNLTSLPN